MSRFEDIHDLLSAIELVDVVVHEERARRVVIPEGADGDQPAPSTSLGVRTEGSTLRYRFRMVLVDSAAEYVADYEAVYLAVDVEEIDVADDVQQEFAGKVAFMAVYPFLRASVFTSAARLGNSRPVLQMVRLGDFELGDPMPESAIQEAFFDDKSELFEGRGD